MDDLKSDLDNTKETMELPEQTHNIKAKVQDPKEFYGQGDSVYIKVTYIEDKDAFKFDVKNEIIEQHYGDTDILPPPMVSLSAFIRGMLECALSAPHQMYSIGVRAINADLVSNMSDLTDEQRKLLMGNVEGSA
jgi:hypothetical protein